MGGKKFVAEFLHFTDFVWGRGLYYMMIGSLMGGYSHGLVGLMILLVGAATFYFGELLPRGPPARLTRPHKGT